MKVDRRALPSECRSVNHRGIAAAIVGLIRDDDLSPLTIGVHGDGGSGKSTVLELVRTELANHEKVALLVFNGWLFWTEKIKNGAVRLLKRVNWLKAARKATAAALAIPTGGASMLINGSTSSSPL